MTRTLNTETHRHAVTYCTEGSDGRSATRYFTDGARAERFAAGIVGTETRYGAVSLAVVLEWDGTRWHNVGEWEH